MSDLCDFGLSAYFGWSAGVPRQGLLAVPLVHWGFFPESRSLKTVAVVTSLGRYNQVNELTRFLQRGAPRRSP